MKHIIFISNAATPTGAHRFLLDLIKHLSSIKIYEITLLCISEGALLPQFQKYCKVYVLHKPNASLITRLIYKIKRPIIRKYLEYQNYDVVYANTIHTLPFALKFQKATHKILHIHELATFLSPYRLALEKSIFSFSKVVACSQLVHQHLLENYSIDISKTEIITPFIKTIGSYGKNQNNTFTVGFCGGIHWVKGTDLIPIIVSKVLLLQPNIRFIWIGYESSDPDAAFIANDFYKLGISENITLLPFSDKPETLFATLDLFVLTSREESFSIVSLENIAMGVPVICFDKSIGAVEFIEKGAGSVLPYLDLDRVAQEIVAYANDPKKIKTAIDLCLPSVQPYNSATVLEKFEAMLVKLDHEKN